MDLRDTLLVMNALAMIGGAFTVVVMLRAEVAMLRAEVKHFTDAVTDLKKWLMSVDSRLRMVEVRSGER